MAGRFIVFEGIDGSGKSTAIHAVAKALRRDGMPVWSTREETPTWRGEAVRRAIQEKEDPVTTAFLFLADRAAHIPEIQEHLDAGDTVLCDRFMHSTLAYQSVTLADRIQDAQAWLRAAHEPWCPMPDHVILLALDGKTAVGRVAGRGASTNYEKAGFLDKVAAAYRGLAAADPDRFTVIDAKQPADAVAAACVAAIERLT